MLQERPEFLPGTREYFEAFFLLSSFRTSGPAGPNPIQFSEIISYAKVYGYHSYDEITALIQIVRSCDDAWLKAVSIRAEQESEHAARKRT